VKFKTVNGFLFPESDQECAAAMFMTVDDLEVYYPFCRRFDVAIQAGGNVGVWPKKMASKFKTVYTFEPDPENFACLVGNLLDTGVIKLQAALGNERGPVGMHRTPLNVGAHYVEGKGHIPTIRIDDLELPMLDFLMLDIEGYELAAVKGGEDTIKAYLPCIVVEDKHYRGGSERGAIQALLAGWGYRQAAKKNRDAVFVHESMSDAEVWFNKSASGCGTRWDELSEATRQIWERKFAPKDEIC
jgi:FkbM family methyltransferase